jgi:hypothetical protein
MVEQRIPDYRNEDWAMADSIAQGLLQNHEGDVGKAQLVLCMSMTLLDNTVNCEDPKSEGFYAVVQRTLRELKFISVHTIEDISKPRN